MPIKPENKARYPANWLEIRAAILLRANNCCEQCKVPNGARIARGAGPFANTFQMDNAEVYDAETGERIARVRMGEYQLKNMVTIVLTIAHLDHTPENVDHDNLRAWCQMHHLRYDAKHHAESARLTRRALLNNQELFEEQS